jgi:hypothetical protein
MSFDTGTFVRVEGGYNARFDAGHQVLAALRAGQFVADWLLLYAGVGLAYTVTPGRVIGVSVAAEDPLLPADRYLGVENLFLREVRLQRDVLDVQGGAIFRITPEAELNVGYGRIVWGRNTAAVNSVFMTMSVRTDLGRPGEPEALSEREEQDDVPVGDAVDAAPVSPAPLPPAPTDQGEVAAQAGNIQQTQTPTSPRMP